MSDLRPSDLVDAFHDRTLPKPEWTHEAHLIVCWYALREMGVEEAVAHLRRAIRAYNEATGTPNTDDSGYHETLTRYYVEAIAQLVGQPLDDVYKAEDCRREAPLNYWSREALFSVAARRDWLDPDLDDLPWRRQHSERVSPGQSA
jgi:hypothetical protein